MEALGCHVFAGGFTMGVMKEMEVLGQLEVHNFGRETAESIGIDFINRDDAADWPTVKPCFLFGNPRCTGFSCVTAGQSSHGPFAPPTRDAVEFVRYATEISKPPVFAWESVQQAYGVGKPLLNRFRDEFLEPNGYRLAHVFLNAASFGNAQNRRRYFFVGYRKGLNFNVSAPELGTKRTYLEDILRPDWDRVTYPRPNRELNRGDPYGRDDFYDLCEDEWALVSFLPTNMNLNTFAKKHTDLLEKYSERYSYAWHTRTSECPFSFHSMHRTCGHYAAPTLYGGAITRLIHPEHDRPLTIGELSRIMGWGDVIPSGPKPGPQICKGIVPELGAWLARMAKHCINGDWGNDDFESSYCNKDGRWEGRNTAGEIEKVFDLTRYVVDYDDEYYLDRADKQRLRARFDSRKPKWAHGRDMQYISDVRRRTADLAV